jgi:hypothetical protein
MKKLGHVSFIMLLLSVVFLANTACATSLDRGTMNTFTGDLGDVDVSYVQDAPFIDGFLGPPIIGEVNIISVEEDPIPTLRIQYDIFNTSFHGIREFQVNFEAGTVVIGATDPNEYYGDFDNTYVNTGGVAYTTVFDEGYGVYHYNVDSSWEIEYAETFVKWTWVSEGVGLIPGALVGLGRDEELGPPNDEVVALPAFSIDFAPGTQFGMQLASVLGTVEFIPETSSGMVLSAVSPCANAGGDSDNDSVCNDDDNCPEDKNANQWDGDEDGVGDVCDNCEVVANPGQEDTNENDIGDVCEEDNAMSTEDQGENIVQCCFTFDGAPGLVFWRPDFWSIYPEVAINGNDPDPVCENYLIGPSLGVVLCEDASPGELCLEDLIPGEQYCFDYDLAERFDLGCLGINDGDSIDVTCTFSRYDQDPDVKNGVCLDPDGECLFNIWSGRAVANTVTVIMQVDAPTCDIDADGDIDRNDVRQILRNRNRPASGPDDPMDADGDGMITSRDAKICIKQCTYPRCADSNNR